MMSSGIYKIENLINGKCYIGRAKDFKVRWYSHRGSLKRGNHKNKHFQSAYNKYGKENFIYSVVEYVENPEDLIEREQFWIDSYDWSILYNTAPKAGSNLGVKLSKEHRKQISERQLGEKNHMYGKKVSKETKEKLSKSKIGSKNPMYGKTGEKCHFYGMKGELSPNHGRKHSDEARKRMSESKKGPKNPNYGKYGEENSFYGKKHTEEAKKNMSDTKKRLYAENGNPRAKIYTFGDTSQSMKEWAEELDVLYTTFVYRVKHWGLEKAITYSRQ